MITNLGILNNGAPFFEVPTGSAYSFLSTRPFNDPTYVLNVTRTVDRSTVDINAVKEINFDTLMTAINNSVTADLNNFEDSNTVEGYSTIGGLSVKVTSFHEQTPTISYELSMTIYVKIT